MKRSRTAWMIVGEDGLFIRQGNTEVEAIARHVFAMRLPDEPQVYQSAAFDFIAVE